MAETALVLKGTLIAQPTKGIAFEVMHGQVLRVVLVEGPQVVDFDVFNSDNLKERFSSSVTRSNHGAHLTKGHTLNSIPPYLNPMFTITDDTVAHKANPQGTISHDLLFGRCNWRVRKEAYNSDSNGCQENIAGVIAKYGLEPEDVHDPLNIFMTTALNEAGKPIFIDPDAVAGDYLELQAEMNCLVAASICPGRSSGPVPHIVHFEIYERA